MLPYRELSELNFLEVLIAIVISWIIIDLWLRVIENFAYRTIGLSEKSTIHTLVVALVVTIIFITFVFSVPGSVTDLIIGETYTEEDVYGASDSDSGNSFTNTLSTFDPTDTKTRSANIPALGSMIVDDLSNLPKGNLKLPHVINETRKDKFLHMEPDVRRGERLVHRSIYKPTASRQEQSVQSDISISRNIPHDVGARYLDDRVYGSERRRHKRCIPGNNSLLRASDWSRPGDEFFQSYSVSSGGI